MKKIIIIVLLIAFSFNTFAQLNKVAVVTIYGNKMIDGSDFGAMNSLRTLAQDDAFNLSGIIQKFRDELFNDFSKDFPFSLVDESLVVGNQEYINYGEMNKKSLVDYFCTMPENYYYFVEVKDPINNLFQIFEKEDVDGLMFVSIDYKLYKTSQIAGFGTAKVYAYVNMKIFDKSGKKIFSLREYEPSKKNLKFALGGAAIEADKILPLCEQATEAAFIKMKAKLPKSLAKMNKKLNKKANK